MVCMAEREDRTKNGSQDIVHVRVDISGIVQGVGFRPFVYKLALDNNLKGTVLNNERGVQIRLEGLKKDVDAFLEALKTPPPIALIETIDIIPAPRVGYSNFKIEKSQKAGAVQAFIPPDVAVCNDCIGELFDPADRRYGYPFINCTNCGPRFTIIKDIPYDRPHTTMAQFEMCDKCRVEYEDPLNRRFHAQPVACPDCGPHVTLIDKTGKAIETPNPVEETARLLEAGKIVAIKGLGGFHLACDAYNEKAVSELRKRKYREDKPFAIMCRDISVARKLCKFGDEISEILQSPQSPIVILPRRDDDLVSPSVAPGHRFLGIMLPYTPLHHLIFSYGPETLVMTSGNLSDEPIVFTNNEALKRLHNIADYFLINDRDIYIRCDDSVIKPFRNGKTFFRRARGYVPFPVKLGKQASSVLSCGAELKNTFCLTKGNYAFISHHVGDLENWETFTAFEQGIEHFKKLFEINPEAVVYDLHPDYLSTQYALSLDIPRIGIQHHYAHALSCMAEYNLTSPLVAIIMDGTGYGTDGTIWGCEFLKVDTSTFERLGHLRYIRLPGGERAIREPWRIAAAYLERTIGTEWDKFDLPFCRNINHRDWEVLKKSMQLGHNAPLCSSAGRLFDAVSALLGVRSKINYEGQAAIELEQLAVPETHFYSYSIEQKDSSFIVDPDPIFEDVINDIKNHVGTDVISGRFHLTMARIIGDTASKMRDLTGYSEIVLSGGVFQNHFLLELAVQILEEKGFKVYINQKVPANDGGISLGQAYYGVLNYGE